MKKNKTKRRGGGNPKMDRESRNGNPHKPEKRRTDFENPTIKEKKKLKKLKRRKKNKRDLGRVTKKEKKKRKIQKK